MSESPTSRKDSAWERMPRSSSLIDESHTQLIESFSLIAAPSFASATPSVSPSAFLSSFLSVLPTLPSIIDAAAATASTESSNLTNLLSEMLRAGRTGGEVGRAGAQAR